MSGQRANVEGREKLRHILLALCLNVRSLNDVVIFTGAAPWLGEVSCGESCLPFILQQQ